ncbi:hypothetical protein NCLIV_032100 [Neospora caninum Liverpool]|uniref:CSC1/OSCA1-like 7TM region domain-containing protein n=1 Tax=Neospora caninum (strain Liverpool) TaxID=572307 RepID=F0VI62_NEOCL|nr:hypothetical protein NCLIV_032100 [Neospora caninum Liverpool]CBZ53423.1 hypothetical protein NCLIV_032100 [Neospora caninum Liverpool]|eukprot:XP_003883455.1 hypothetical protein NCLIV_032100 [Neospora caninum Liverpool]
MRGSLRWIDCDRLMLPAAARALTLPEGHATPGEETGRRPGLVGEDGRNAREGMKRPDLGDNASTAAGIVSPASRVSSQPAPKVFSALSFSSAFGPAPHLSDVVSHGNRGDTHAALDLSGKDRLLRALAASPWTLNSSEARTRRPREQDAMQSEGEVREEAEERDGPRHVRGFASIVDRAFAPQNDRDQARGHTAPRSAASSFARGDQDDPFLELEFQEIRRARQPPPFAVFSDGLLALPADPPHAQQHPWRASSNRLPRMHVSVHHARRLDPMSPSAPAAPAPSRSDSFPVSREYLLAHRRETTDAYSASIDESQFVILDTELRGLFLTALYDVLLFLLALLCWLRLRRFRGDHLCLPPDVHASLSLRRPEGDARLPSLRSTASGQPPSAASSAPPPQSPFVPSPCGAESREPGASRALPLEDVAGEPSGAAARAPGEGSEEGGRQLSGQRAALPSPLMEPFCLNPPLAVPLLSPLEQKQAEEGESRASTEDVLPRAEPNFQMSLSLASPSPGATASPRETHAQSPAERPSASAAAPRDASAFSPRSPEGDGQARTRSPEPPVAASGRFSSGAFSCCFAACRSVKACCRSVSRTCGVLRDIYLAMESPVALLHRRVCTEKRRRRERDNPRAREPHQEQAQTVSPVRDKGEERGGRGERREREGRGEREGRAGVNSGSFYAPGEDGSKGEACAECEPGEEKAETKGSGAGVSGRRRSASGQGDDDGLRNTEGVAETARERGRMETTKTPGTASSWRDSSWVFPDFWRTTEDRNALDFDCLKGDMAAYLHFLKTARACCQAICIACFLVLIPLYVIGEKPHRELYTFLDMCTAVDKSSKAVLWSITRVRFVVFRAFHVFAALCLPRFPAPVQRTSGCRLVTDFLLSVASALVFERQAIRAPLLPSRSADDSRLSSLRFSGASARHSPTQRVIGRQSPLSVPCLSPFAPPAGSTDVFSSLPCAKTAGDRAGSTLVRLPSPAGTHRPAGPPTPRALSGSSHASPTSALSPVSFFAPPRVAFDPETLESNRIWLAPPQAFAVMLTCVDRRVVDSQAFASAFVDLHQLYCSVCTAGRMRQVRLLDEEQRKNAREGRRRGTAPVGTDDWPLLLQDEARRAGEAHEANEAERAASRPVPEGKRDRKANRGKPADRRVREASGGSGAARRATDDKEQGIQFRDSVRAKALRRALTAGTLEAARSDAGRAPQEESAPVEARLRSHSLQKSPSNPEELSRFAQTRDHGEQDTCWGSDEEEVWSCFVPGTFSWKCSCVVKVRLVMQCGKLTCVDESLPRRDHGLRPPVVSDRPVSPSALRLSPETPLTSSSCFSHCRGRPPSPHLALPSSTPSASQPEQDNRGSAQVAVPPSPCYASSSRGSGRLPPALLSPSSLFLHHQRSTSWTQDENRFFDGEDSQEAPVIFTPAARKQAETGRGRGDTGAETDGGEGEEDEGARGGASAGCCGRRRRGERGRVDDDRPRQLALHRPSRRPPCRPLAPYRNAGVAFVVFDNQICVKETLQTPSDINWDNLHISRFNQVESEPAAAVAAGSSRRPAGAKRGCLRSLSRIVGLNALLVILCVTIISPVAILNELTPIVESIDEQLIEHRLTRLTITAWLPPLILLLINSVVQPLLISYVAAGSGYWLKSVETAYTVHGNIVFQILNTLVIPLLSLSSIDSVLRIMYTNEIRDWSLILGFTLMHSSGSFALRYLLNLTFLGTANEMLQIFPLIMSRIDTYFYGSAERRKYPFDIGYAYAQALSVFTLVLMFSVVVPLILPLGILYFCFRFKVDKYNYMFHVYADLDFNSNGHLAVTAIKYMLFAVAFLQFAMAGFFVSQDDTWMPVAGGFMLFISLVSQADVLVDPFVLLHRPARDGQCQRSLAPEEQRRRPSAPPAATARAPRGVSAAVWRRVGLCVSRAFFPEAMGKVNRGIPTR